MLPAVVLRTATIEDRAFVERVYFEAQRWIIDALFGWKGESVERATFEKFYVLDETQIICVDGQDAGWISVHRSAEISIESLFLLPAYRRLGIGSRLIRSIIGEAVNAGRPLHIATANINPARNLYKRLGFRETSEEAFKVHLHYEAIVEKRTD